MAIQTLIGSKASLSERARPLLDEIRQRAGAIEEARQVPADIIQKLVDIGFYRARWKRC